MPNKKIAVITDMTFIGSGYYYMMTNLLTGLSKLGYEITIAGLGYMGEPHEYPFSIIPSPNLQDAISIVANLNFLKRCDLVLVGLDIPLQMHIFENLKGMGKPYMAITPMENGPLVQTWAMAMSNMSFVWFISEMAKQEALKAGLTKVDHLNVGVDTELWKPATPDQRVQLRTGMGIEPDEFVIMTVADNQERKNLWAGMRIVGELKTRFPNKKFRYLIVTKEDSPVGWKLRDLAQSEGIIKEYLPFQRGLPARDLWGLYAVADVYLQPSKAEGLGLPVLEAMACAVPCVTTDTGAMHELLQDKRGLLVPPEYSFVDVWGNSRRDMISISKGAEYVGDMLKWKDEGMPWPTQPALDYVRSRTWDIAVNQMDAKITEILNNEPKQAEKG